MNWLYSVLILMGLVTVGCVIMVIITRIKEEQLQNMIAGVWVLCWLVLGVNLIHAVLVSVN